MKMLYKYPHAVFPYGDLVTQGRWRGFRDPEYELLDTGAFAEIRYFDVFVECAKADQEDILIRITVANRGPEPADCWVLPTLWFRNTWSWGYQNGPMNDVAGKPVLRQVAAPEMAAGVSAVHADHPAAGRYHLYAAAAPELLFTENETNAMLLYRAPNPSPYVKDAFHRCIVNADTEAVNPYRLGTKVAAVYRYRIAAGASRSCELRLSRVPHADPFAAFPDLFARRRVEADQFYAATHRAGIGADERNV